MTDGAAKLVVIDDDHEVASVIAMIGQHAEYDVSIFNDARTIGQESAVLAADLITLDLQMPSVDGIQVLRGLAERKVKASIVLISGMDDRTRSAAEMYGRERGLDILATIEKPFSPEDLLKLLRTAQAKVTPLRSTDLEQAIELDELAIVYQPTVRRDEDGTWIYDTAEALLRWDHPERGLLSPAEFLTMGEDAGLITAMTDFVLQRGLEQLRGWQLQNVNFGLRVNVSAMLLTDIDFPDRLETLFDELDIDPETLTLEITEAGMLNEHPDTIDILARVRLKKIKLAIDDFGIGYSSLTQLFRMPFSEMKIDHSLLSQIPHSGEACIAVQALVDLAHRLKLSVCAEGVESEAALDFMHSIGCDCAQGYFIARPMAASEIPRMLRMVELHGDRTAKIRADSSLRIRSG